MYKFWILICKKIVKNCDFCRSKITCTSKNEKYIFPQITKINQKARVISNTYINPINSDTSPNFGDFRGYHPLAPSYQNFWHYLWSLMILPGCMYEWLLAHFQIITTTAAAIAAGLEWKSLMSFTRDSALFTIYSFGIATRVTHQLWHHHLWKRAQSDHFSYIPSK